MPYRDPAWWREVAPALAGGLMSALFVAFLAAAAPRPWPAGHITKAIVETLAAWIVGTLAAIYMGPLVAQLAHLEGAEAIGGVKVIVGVVGWRALPFLMDMALKVARSQAEKVQ